MTIELIITFSFLALIAEVLGTIGGFGSSLFFIPIASYFLDIHSVLGVTALFHVVSNLTKIGLFKKGIEWKIILWMGIPATLFVIIGAWLSKIIQTKSLELFFAIFLMLLSLFLFLYRNKKITSSSRSLVLGGGLSGFMAGLLGSGGAVRGVFLNSLKLTPAVFIASSALIDISVDASRSVVYFMNGFVHQHDLYLLPILAVVSLLGTYIGKIVVDRLKVEQFQLLVIGLIFLTGLISLVHFY